MKICIRAHDLGVKGTEQILSRIRELGIDGVQMVCYKAYDDIAYQPGAITEEKAAAIGAAFREAGAMIPLVGAYFNPVHSDKEKVKRCFAIFAIVMVKKKWKHGRWKYGTSPIWMASGMERAVSILNCTSIQPAP